MGAYSIAEALQCMLDVVVDVVVIDLVTCMKEEVKAGHMLASLVESSKASVLLLQPRRSMVGTPPSLCMISSRVEDHLVKPFEIEELGSRVDSLLSRKTPGSTAQLLTSGKITLDLQKFELRVNGNHVSLTPTEFDLVQCLMSHSGEVIPTRRLLEEVWKYPGGEGSPEVVRWYIKQLRDKLSGAGCDPETIRTVPRRGYVISPQTETIR